MYVRLHDPLQRCVIRQRVRACMLFVCVYEWIDVECVLMYAALSLCMRVCMRLVCVCTHTSIYEYVLVHTALSICYVRVLCMCAHAYMHMHPGPRVFVYRRLRDCARVHVCRLFRLYSRCGCHRILGQCTDTWNDGASGAHVFIPWLPMFLTHSIGSHVVEVLSFPLTGPHWFTM